LLENSVRTKEPWCSQPDDLALGGQLGQGGADLGRANATEFLQLLNRDRFLKLGQRLAHLFGRGGSHLQPWTCKSSRAYQPSPATLERAEAAAPRHPVRQQATSLGQADYGLASHFQSPQSIVSDALARYAS